MPKGYPKTNKWFSIVSDLVGYDGHRFGMTQISPAAFQTLIVSAGYVTRQGIDHLPQAIPRLAVGPQRNKKAVNELLELGLLVPEEGRYGSYRLAHEGTLWRRGRAPVSRAKIPDAVRAEVYQRDNHACVICGATEFLTLDHIWPWSLGGTDTPDNLRILCRSCNSRKGARADGP